MFWFYIRILLFTARLLVSFRKESTCHSAKASTADPRRHTAELAANQASVVAVLLRLHTRLCLLRRKLARTGLAVGAKITLVLVPNMGIAAHNMDTAGRRAITVGVDASQDPDFAAPRPRE